MNTEVWVYTVQKSLDSNTLWRGIFDCEVSNARVLEVYHKETGYTDGIIVAGRKRTFFDRPFATIPEVQSGTLFALEHAIQSENWFNEQLTKLSLDQPILYAYLQRCKTNHGDVTALVGIIIHKLIESQIEADQL